MYSGKSLDDLIEAGWHVVDTEFDAEAFYYWKKKALAFLTDFVGPNHTCTQSFRDFLQQTELLDPARRVDNSLDSTSDASSGEDESRRVL